VGEDCHHGKQLAPEDLLFSGGGSVGGATAGGVDLDLEGGESRVDFDLLGEPVPGHEGVDLDIGSALGDETHDATGTATDRAFGIENTFSSTSTGTTRQMTQKIGRQSDALTSEFGSESEGPTVEQPQLSNQENPTIRQKVAMALKQGLALNRRRSSLSMTSVSISVPSTRLTSLDSALRRRTNIGGGHGRAFTQGDGRGPASRSTRRPGQCRNRCLAYGR